MNKIVNRSHSQCVGQLIPNKESTRILESLRVCVLFATHLLVEHSADIDTADIGTDVSSTNTVLTQY